MSRVLILYGTTDGHTRKIAAALREGLRDEGLHAFVTDAKYGAATVVPEDYDGVIVAASLHAGGFQKPVVRWARTHAAQLNRMPTAFLAVCLAILEQRPETRRELDAIIGRFQSSTGWRPDLVKPVAGALLYTRYNWLKRWIMRRIVAKAGGDTDTTRDFEYTNWGELRTFARTFGRNLTNGSFVPVSRSLHEQDTNVTV
jgi:menaquinone-dependent protoporphyrinogen oxidase